MSKPYFIEESEAKLLLAGVVALTLLNSGVSVQFSYLSRDFWSALNAKDTEQFQQVLVKFLGALAAGVPVVVFSSYQRELLALRWREWMTERVITLYLGGNGTDTPAAAGHIPLTPPPPFYTIESGGALASSDGKMLDNPDQRIAEDVRSFTRSSLSFSLTLLRAVVDLGSFAAILYSIYPVLFGVIVAYATVGTIVTVVLGRRLVDLNYQVLKQEADFRFSLVRVRENAESIAFYGGQGLERKLINTRLESMMGTRKELLDVERNLDFFTTAYQFLIQILPGAVVAPLFFAGKIELGVVSQSFGAFNHILNDFSIIVNQFEALSQFSAGIGRLGEFAGRLEVENGAQGLLELPVSQSGASIRERALAAVALADAQEKVEAGSGGGAAPAGVGRSGVSALADEAAALLAPTLPGASLHPNATPTRVGAAGEYAGDSALEYAGELAAVEAALNALTAVEVSAAAVYPPRIDVRVSAEAPSTSSSSSRPTGAQPLGADAEPTPPVLRVRGLHLMTPDGSRELISDLSFDLFVTPLKASRNTGQTAAATVAPTAAASATSAASAASAASRPVPSSLSAVFSSSRLLVTGASGSGKSSLLRAIAGLWTAGSGSVVRPPADEMMFLPQRPYCTPGTLREQIVYPQSLHADQTHESGAMDVDDPSVIGSPCKEDDDEDALLLRILDAVNLGGLAEKWGESQYTENTPRGPAAEGASAQGGETEKVEARAASLKPLSTSGMSDSETAMLETAMAHAKAGLNVEVDWGNVLSLGEQQRLAFGRLLYNRPRCAVLDEATSALDVDSEALMFAALNAWLPGTALLSVGHRPTLLAFHDHRLVLTPHAAASGAAATAPAAGPGASPTAGATAGARYSFEDISPSARSAAAAVDSWSSGS